MSRWLLLDNHGQVVAALFSEGAPDAGSGHDTQNLTAVMVEEFKPLDRYTYDVEEGWVERLPEAKSKATDKINTLRETAQLKFLTSGNAKIFSYAQKAQEIAKSESQTPPYAPEDFPFAKAQADLTGQSIQEVLVEFKTGQTSAIAGCAEIEAKAMKALKEISEAQTLAEIDSVLNRWESS